MMQKAVLHETTTRVLRVCLAVAVLLATDGMRGWSEEPVRTDEPETQAAKAEFFEKRIRPLLAEHCYECHSVNADKLQAGLFVDSIKGLIKGGDSGTAIVAGKPEESLLIEAVHYESYEMPPSGKLSDQQIGFLEQWVKEGAYWPDEPEPTPNGNVETFDLEERRQEHWAWQPITEPELPMVATEGWANNGLDRFILHALEEEELRPAAEANPMVVMRRLYFDLIGLPPTEEEIARFAEDPSPDALRRLTDELLDSPHFGERWARHWLDLVRYAESRGHEFDNDASNAYHYRDYIIRALNADIPYDQLVREHIAGDLLPSPRLDPETGANESVLGTGFWFLGEWVHSPVDTLKDESDRFDNMIDVMSKTFLGLTVSCARCHDHKFDAISTADYYSLTGFLQSSDYRQIRFESVEQNRKVANDLWQLDDRYREEAERLADKYGVKRPAGKALPDAAASQVLFDYAKLAPDEFMQDGFLYGERPRLAGEAFVVKGEVPEVQFAEYSAAVSDPFWNGMESLTEKGVKNTSKLYPIPRPGRTLRTPTFELESGRILCRVEGSGHVVACVDSHRLVSGPLHGETVRPIKAGEPFVELDLSRYVGHRIQLEFTPPRDQQLQVLWIANGDKGQIRAARNAVLEQLEKESNEELQNSEWNKAQKELAASWAREREELGKRVVRQSRTAMAMMDGTGEDARIYIRGNSSKPGDVEPRHFLTAIDGGVALSTQGGSGRLELASHINDPNNPLTSRVIVNRLWHHLMGRGIVPTTDDFGYLGLRPTHPELLDHLATRFVADGRSLKEMIRYIVSSQTYQMSSVVSPAATVKDPKNLLWHHRPPRRLEGEAIRDAMLVLSGRLKRELYGEPVPIHLTSFMDGRGRPKKSGPLDGGGRRSIYVAVRRNFLSPFMLAFDTPVPFSTMGRRNSSNVPAQALILMNDPLVVELSADWAEQAMASSQTTDDRIDYLYRTAFAREPSENERSLASQFVAQNKNEPRVWADLAHALINTKEFIFLR